MGVVGYRTTRSCQRILTLVKNLCRRRKAKSAAFWPWHMCFRAPRQVSSRGSQKVTSEGVDWRNRHRLSSAQKMFEESGICRAGHVLARNEMAMSQAS
jgi:hypothetical protein